MSDAARTWARLRWRCRRGTRELDTILLRFLDEVYPRLETGDREAFEALLSEQDPDLAAWILGGDEPPARWAILVARIRAASNI